MNSNTTDSISNPALRGESLWGPRTPARLVRLGSERFRTQRSGAIVLFRAVSVRTEFTYVPSRLDGYSSTWFSTARRWVPVEALSEGQLELTKRV